MGKLECIYLIFLSSFFNPICCESYCLMFTASNRIDGKLAIINTEDIHNFLVAPDGWILEGSAANENGQPKYGYVRTYLPRVAFNILYRCQQTQL